LLPRQKQRIGGAAIGERNPATGAVVTRKERLKTGLAVLARTEGIAGDRRRKRSARTAIPTDNANRRIDQESDGIAKREARQHRDKQHGQRVIDDGETKRVDAHGSRLMLD